MGPRVECSALATWKLKKGLSKQLGDVSDAAVDESGQLYLLSDQSRRVVRMAALPAPGEGKAAAETTWRIAGKVKKPEGLALLPDGRALVGLDNEEAT